jgi:hypothetical protein
VKKRKSRKKSAKVTAKPVPKENPQQVPSEEKDTDSFDFGGIPERDLKKNLGCG